jgi:prevent-host-death family protein
MSRKITSYAAWVKGFVLAINHLGEEERAVLDTRVVGVLGVVRSGGDVMERPSLHLTYSVDHVSLASMKTMLVSDFKAKCIGVLKEVQRTGEPVVVTLRGKPMARVEPLKADKPGKQLGRLEGAITVHCDLVRSDTAGDWEMLT